MKTREDVEDLKHKWKQDPCWDIEETEGFEEYRDELKAFRLNTEAKWKSDQEENIKQLCTKYNCNREMLELLQSLQHRIEVLELREP